MNRRNATLGVAAVAGIGLLAWMVLHGAADAPRVADPPAPAMPVREVALVDAAPEPEPAAPALLPCFEHDGCCVLGTCDKSKEAENPWKPVCRMPNEVPKDGGLPYYLDTADYGDGDFDPDKRPFASWQMDFDAAGVLPAGWKTDNVVLGDGGLRLAVDAPADESGVRKGRLETPPLTMEMAYNAIVPLWKEDAPGGTKVDVAVSVSADGVKWGQWHRALSDCCAREQMAATMPDGSPNPNYGYSLAAPMYGDRRLYKYVRFRATLYSAGDDSPALASLRANLIDVTHGKGELAAIPPGEEFYPDAGGVY